MKRFHLLVALEPTRELHAATGRHGLDENRAHSCSSCRLQAALPRFERFSLCVKIFHLRVDERELVFDECVRVLKRLMLEIRSDGVHAKAKFAQLLDACELIHIGKAVDAVPVCCARRADDTEALVVAQGVDADSKETRHLADGTSVLDARRLHTSSTEELRKA